MKKNKAHNINYSELKEEDIKQIRKTIKRVPNMSNAREKHTIQRRQLLIYCSVLIVAVILVVAGILFFSNGNKKVKSLYGTWNYDDVTIYTFDDNGHGTLVLPLNTYEFSYTVGDGVLSIDFTDEKAEDRSYTYFLSDDVLVLIGPDGNEYRMTRVNSNS